VLGDKKNCSGEEEFALCFPVETQRLLPRQRDSRCSLKAGLKESMLSTKKLEVHGKYRIRNREFLQNSEGFQTDIIDIFDHSLELYSDANPPDSLISRLFNRETRLFVMDGVG